MEFIQNVMQSNWYITLMEITLWSVEFLFFVMIAQLFTLVGVKVLYSINRVEEISADLFANITVLSILVGLFAKMYLV